MRKIKPYETMNYDKGDIGIDEVQVTYVQNADCTEDQDDVQTIVLTARNNGIARFVNIKTESWSVDDAEELLKLVKDFISRAAIVCEEPEKENTKNSK